MGISKLQGCPWHIEYITKKKNEDKLFSGKKKKKLFIDPNEGEDYVVDDPSSGINGQKVTLIEAISQSKFKVKLGNKTYIVKQLGIVKDEAQHCQSEQEKRQIVTEHNNSQETIRVFQKNRAVPVRYENKPIHITTSSNDPNLSPGDRVNVHLSGYKNKKCIFDKEVPQGYRIKIVNNSSETYRVVPKNTVSKKGVKRTS